MSFLKYEISAAALISWMMFINFMYIIQFLCIQNMVKIVSFLYFHKFSQTYKTTRSPLIKWIICNIFITEYNE